MKLQNQQRLKLNMKDIFKERKLLQIKLKDWKVLKIPEDIDYNELVSISTEGRQKLNKNKTC